MKEFCVLKVDENGKVGLFMPNGDEIKGVSVYNIEPLSDKNDYGKNAFLTVKVELVCTNELFKSHK